MKMLCLDRPRPGATPSQYAPHMQDELRQTWEHYKAGIFRDIYFRQDRPGVAIFVEYDSTAEAEQALAELPLVKAGLIDFEVIPLGPFTNWELLFAQPGGGQQ
jgi:hypothetical protein